MQGDGDEARAQVREKCKWKSIYRVNSNLSGVSLSLSLALWGIKLLAHNACIDTCIFSMALGRTQWQQRQACSHTHTRARTQNSNEAGVGSFFFLSFCCLFLFLFSLCSFPFRSASFVCEREQIRNYTVKYTERDRTTGGSQECVRAPKMKLNCFVRTVEKIQFWNFKWFFGVPFFFFQLFWFFFLSVVWTLLRRSAHCANVADGILCQPNPTEAVSPNHSAEPIFRLILYW